MKYFTDSLFPRETAYQNIQTSYPTNNHQTLRKIIIKKQQNIKELQQKQILV